ncbi:MAG: DegV family protein, partial [Clostridia bacterium]|nr:DegV family protein [Clostridia bacterium]
EDQYVYLAHSDVSDEELDALKKLITDKIPCKGVVTLPIGPIIGASIGPDAVGLWAWGKEVTYRVSDAD